MRSLLLAFVLGACGSVATPPPASDGRPEIAITVDENGYTPSEVEAAAGAPVRLVFTRANAENCGGEVVFPDLDIRRELPVGVAVPIDLTMPASGQVVFTCGMDMYRGAIVAR